MLRRSLMFKCKKDLLFLVFCKKQLYFCSPFYRIFKTTAYMKRFTLIVALVLMVAMPTFAERVSSETAQKVATTFLNNNGAKTAQLTDLTKEAGFKNLYIFNGNPGFVVMAADDCVQPILGYSLTGKFVAENMPTNVSGWLQGYNDEIQYAIDNKVKASDETSKLWKELADGNTKAAKAVAVVNALVQTKWDQNGFYYYSGGQLLMFELYNNLCPYDSNAGERTVTGCVATAMAQIMKYWGYPSQGVGSHSYIPSTRPDLGVQSANFGATTYQWNQMPIELNSYSTSTEINAVATLMYHCGVSVEMMYDISSNGGSGAYSEDLPYALVHYFNYKTTVNFKYKADYTNNNWINLLKTELNAGRPIEYNGRGNGGGHAFVCDGYDNSNNFHFNWGWSGSNDGFYALTSLVPGSGGAGGGSYDFTENQCAVFGIEPSTSIPSPANLTYTLSGLQDVTLTWDASNGASSYNVYRNNNLIGNTTSTTYADTAPFGTNDYYIRAVDSNGQQSLPSNTVTVTIDYQTPIVTDLTANLSGNNANLTWTAPEWCYPEVPSTTLTYGNGAFEGSLGTGSTGQALYWGHRYLASNLTPYDSKIIYKISFYVNEPGAYDCYVFKGTAQYSTYYYPTQELAHLSITASETGWFDLDLSETIEIDGSQDLWVFVSDPVGRQYPASYCSFSENVNGSYFSNYYPNANVSGYLPGTISNTAWLIRAFVTDGTYTYNLYDGTTTVASNISSTTYTVNNITNNTAHRYTLKTNFNGGLTEASNMAGITLGTASLASLTMAANDKMTVTENSTLTVSGTLSDVNADNLILENGAQLINNSTGVQATVKKNISGYTGDGGWYTLSTPFVSLTPSADNGLISGSYDLYAYDEDGDTEGKEWINFKSGSFDLTPSSGYLYANSAAQTLDLSGELNSGAYSQTVNLGYNNSIGSLKGFNLLGNPTAHEINFTKSSNVSDGYYYVDNGDTWIYSTSSSVPAGRGFLVKANATGQTVTLNPQSKGGNPDKGQYLRLSIGENNVYVKLSEGVSMPLIDFKGKHSNLYLLCDHKPYVMLVNNDAEALDLCFETRHNGTQTITVDAINLGLNYLHLIDNLTGNDVDLLATPSYTFEAKTSDYATRFKLLFAPICEDADGDNATFAFISDGNIIIMDGPSTGSGTCATLQIVDTMGRVVVEGAAMNRVSTSEMTPGVYVLRLINGEKVQTQKIVIE